MHAHVHASCSQPGAGARAVPGVGAGGRLVMQHALACPLTSPPPPAQEPRAGTCWLHLQVERWGMESGQRLLHCPAPTLGLLACKCTALHTLAPRSPDVRTGQESTEARGQAPSLISRGCTLLALRRRLGEMTRAIKA